MKKTLSIVLCLMMLLSCVTAGISTVFAADNGTDLSMITAKGTGTLNIYKNQTAQTVESAESGLNGATFTIYQVMKLGEDGLYYLSDDFGDVFTIDGEDLTTSTGNSGYLTYGDTDKLENQINALVAQINEVNSDADDTNDITGTSMTTSGYKNETTYAYTDGETSIQAGLAQFTNVDTGVYLVVETGVPTGYTAKTSSFLVALTESTKDSSGAIVVNAYPKNAEKGKLDKVIVTDVGNTQKNDSASIGDTINYKITGQVPVYDEEVLKKVEQQDSTSSGSDVVKDKDGQVVTMATIPFYFVDTLSDGLTYTEGSLKLTVGGDEFTVDNTDYNLTQTTNSDGSTTLLISIPFNKLYNSANSVNYMGASVEITYSAVLNENAAVIDTGNGVTQGEVNDLDLYYANSPSDYKISLYYNDSNEPDPDPNVPDPDQPDDDPQVFTYEMDLAKTLNGSNFTDVTGVTASDITFTLYTDENCTEAVNVSEVKAGVNGKYLVSSTSTTAVMTLADDGTICVKGLGAGTYYLKEITTADGYTLLTAPVEIIVEETTDATSGNVTGTVAAYTYKNSDGSAKKTALDSTDGTFKISVNNSNSQFNLPTTGGLGLWMYTIGGAVVLAAAIMIFVSVRKKKSAK